MVAKKKKIDLFGFSYGPNAFGQTVRIQADSEGNLYRYIYYTHPTTGIKNVRKGTEAIDYEEFLKELEKWIECIYLPISPADFTLKIYVNGHWLYSPTRAKELNVRPEILREAIIRLYHNIQQFFEKGRFVTEINGNVVLFEM